MTIPVDVILLGERPARGQWPSTRTGSASRILNEVEEDGGGGVEFKCGGDSQLAVTASTTGTRDDQTQAQFRVSDIAAEVAELRRASE